MKLLTTPALRLDDTAFVATELINDIEGYDYKWWFCSRYVLKLFDLPITETIEDGCFKKTDIHVKRIWFEFHDRPAADRVSYELIKERITNDDSVVRIDGEDIRMAGNTARFIAKKIKSKCYVECHFTEELS